MNTIRVYKADGGDHLPDEYTANVAGSRLHVYDPQEILQYCWERWPNLLFQLEILWS